MAINMKFFFKRKKIARCRIKQTKPELFFIEKYIDHFGWKAIDVAYSLDEAEEKLNYLIELAPFPRIVKEVKVEKY